MPDVTYPLDLTGNAATNLVTDELHTVTEANFRDYFFIVPNFAPFYVDNFQLVLTAGGIDTILTEGVEYNFALPYVAGIRSTGKMMYGAVTLNNLDINGVLKVRYQTVGGPWVVNRIHVLTQLAERAYNPRTTIWDTITNKPELFPHTPHQHDLDNMAGMEDLVSALDRIRDELIEHRDESPFVKHLSATGNPHGTTIADLGLRIAELSDLATTASPDLLINAPVLMQHLENLTAEIANFNNQLSSGYATPKLRGVSALQVGAEGRYQITDYDTATSYIVQSSDLDLSVDLDEISYRAPDRVMTTDLVVNSRNFTVSVTDHGFTQIDTFHAQVPALSEHFGTTISASDDLYRIAVGCPDTNKVYIHSLQSGVVGHTHTITKPDAVVSRFGQSVCMHPDGQHLLVGAPDSTDGIGGRVYSYAFTGGMWVLMNTYQGIGDRHFGAAIHRTQNGLQVVIGAPGNDPDSGYVHQSTWNGHNVTTVYTIVGETSSFGQSLYITDIGLLVGSPDEGVVTYYDLTSSDVQILKPNVLATMSGYGFSLAISMDGMYLAVGSPDDGSVYIYRWSGQWLLDHIQRQHRTGDALGTSVCFRNDHTLLVGAPGYRRFLPADGASTGGLYSMRRGRDGWTVTSKLLDINGSDGDSYAATLHCVNRHADNPVLIAAIDATAGVTAGAGVVHLVS